MLKAVSEKLKNCLLWFQQDNFNKLTSYYSNNSSIFAVIF
jgi:hypothetical protein